MSVLKLAFTASIALLLSGAAFAQSAPQQQSDPLSPLCVPGAKLEALSEGAWYPVTVLDPLRDGRCFIHYDSYGSDDDEAVTSKLIRARR